MAEVIYGHPINHDKLVRDFPATTQEIERILSAFADRAEYEQSQRPRTTSLRVLDFKRKG
jgi:hypothetical protein